MFTRHLRFLACLRAWLSEEQKLVELRKLRKQFVVLSKYRAAGGFSLGNYRDPTVRQYNNNQVLLSLPAPCSTMIVIPQQLLFFLSKLSHHRPVVTIWLLKSRKPRRLTATLPHQSHKSHLYDYDILDCHQPALICPLARLRLRRAFKCKSY